jgi:hypothetical protein
MIPQPKPINPLKQLVRANGDTITLMHVLDPTSTVYALIKLDEKFEISVERKFQQLHTQMDNFVIRVVAELAAFVQIWGWLHKTPSKVIRAFMLAQFRRRD